MDDKYIDELHRIRAENYEATKDLPFEQRQEHIHKGAMEFLRLVEQKKADNNKPEI